MIIVKKDWFNFLSKPIHTIWFGKNKTWRGMLLLPLLNGAFMTMFNSLTHFFHGADAFLLGLIIGLIYMISELPNSFLKRRLGIQPGAKAVRNGYLFLMLDKMDSALGVAILCKFLLLFSWKEAFLLFIFSCIIHASFSCFLVSIRIKKSF